MAIYWRHWIIPEFSAPFFCILDRVVWDFVGCDLENRKFN